MHTHTHYVCFVSEVLAFPMKENEKEETPSHIANTKYIQIWEDTINGSIHQNTRY